MVEFFDIENAFEFVSSDQPFMNSAILNKNTGKIYYRSEFSGVDEFPENYNIEEFIDIPHKNDLNLGRNLVFDFVSKYAPNSLDEVASFFYRKGAYSRYKNLLESIGLLKKWYDFENESMVFALKEWCKENNIEFIAPNNKSLS